MEIKRRRQSWIKTCNSFEQHSSSFLNQLFTVQKRSRLRQRMLFDSWNSQTYGVVHICVHIVCYEKQHNCHGSSRKAINIDPTLFLLKHACHYLLINTLVPNTKFTIQRPLLRLGRDCFCIWRHIKGFRQFLLNLMSPKDDTIPITGIP